jgi:hypothetical protein
MATLTMREIQDVKGYVAKVVGDELGFADEDAIQEALAFVSAVDKELPPGEDLGPALSGLRFHLLRWRRAQHPEVRRNTSAGTTYSYVATGLAEGEGAAALGRQEVPYESHAFIRSIFKSEADFRDSRLMGKLLGVPSAAMLASGAAADVWATLESEDSPGSTWGFKL